jgi:ADP-dependent NAD(P)H-hydrate dehydratase / NAD(P)H-hydrate epimerase
VRQPTWADTVGLAVKVGSMPRIHCLQPHASYPLHNAAATRQIEHLAAAQLPPHALMQRAGLAVARLACALAPHAQTIWVACGPGNNGGDGFEAAMHLQRWGHRPVVTFYGDEARLPADARAALARAREAGVLLASEPPAQCDLAIDALLGIGAGGSGAQANSITGDGAGKPGRPSANAALATTEQAPATARPLPPRMASWLLHMHQSAGCVLCVDVPSGLHADTGTYADTEYATQLVAGCALFHWSKRIFCVNLLTLKPGVFTAQGKDAAGQVWWDDLGVSALTTTPDAVALAAQTAHQTASPAPSAWLLGADRASLPHRPHASHKGTWGDVAVVGGAPGMLGAALLAGRAAMHAGAGRVFVGLLDGAGMAVDPTQPELMFRHVAAIDMRTSAVVCGCGGGNAVGAVLPQVLSQAQRAVLDADALNAIAQDSALQTLLVARAQRGHATILTPHPLEAARLLQGHLGAKAGEVQANRMQAAQQLAERFQCTVVLKGAGSVVAAPGQVPCINSSGNAQLASGGTGDVLAGMAGAHLAAGHSAFQAACTAVFTHGRVADDWPQRSTLVASGMAEFITNRPLDQ